ncbi:MAG TPA: hypothetical protein VN259_16445 [Xanthomonadales bacterium]|nr:hypothetical protein [Xanthomonadales bacterium]
MACAAPVIRQVSGANPAAIQATVDLFRADLGGANNGVGGSFGSGRREINWDGVPDASAAPNFLPADFFNVTSARGAIFNTLRESTGLNQMRVSANAGSGTPVRFGDIDPSYESTFQTFTAQRLFQVRNASNMDVTFFVPGTRRPATVSGFGVVFTDVDAASNAIVRCFAQDGSQLVAASAPAASGGLSFVGISFNTAAERCFRVQIRVGNAPLASGTVDGAVSDVIAMDDFIYGEPQPVFQ